jgi:exosortase N
MPVWTVFAYLLLILGLNIFSNLVRMMLLVIFQVFPETLMHDVIGIICLLVQVVLPAWVVCRFLVFRLSHKNADDADDTDLRIYGFFHVSYYQPCKIRENLRYPRSKYLVQLACCALLWVAALQVAEKKSEDAMAAPSVTFQGHTATPYSKGILKLENDISLVYIKKIRWFCDTEHNPMICWSGGGYRISQVQETVFDGMTIYTGILQKDDDTLYTAWWYSNGHTTTNSQIRWRWDMLTGAPAYSLFNVTADSHEKMKSEIVKIK